MSSGRIFAPTLWYVPTRMVPASPAASADRSAHAASIPATIRSACRSRTRPASVIETFRGPPGRSISRSPTARSSVAICWETADCVYPSFSRGRPEGALLRHRPEGREVPHLDPEPSITFHDRYAR